MPKGCKRRGRTRSVSAAVPSAREPPFFPRTSRRRWTRDRAIWKRNQKKTQTRLGFRVSPEPPSFPPGQEGIKRRTPHEIVFCLAPASGFHGLLFLCAGNVLEGIFGFVVEQPSASWAVRAVGGGRPILVGDPVLQRMQASRGIAAKPNRHFEFPVLLASPGIYGVCRTAAPRASPRLGVGGRPESMPCVALPFPRDLAERTRFRGHDFIRPPESPDHKQQHGRRRGHQKTDCRRPRRGTRLHDTYGATAGTRSPIDLRFTRRHDTGLNLAREDRSTSRDDPPQTNSG